MSDDSDFYEEDEPVVEIRRIFERGPVQYTAASFSTTYIIDRPCALGSCRLAEMDHYDQPGTGFMWCHTHGRVVGTVA